MELLQKNVITKEKKDIIKRGLLGLSIPLISMSYPLLNHYRGDMNSVFIFVDKLIPFNKFFILPYISWYIFITIFSAILCILDRERYLKLLITLNIGMITCYIIYYFYPTYVPRPLVSGTDVFSNLILSLYEVDNPYNCFPSIHVLDSVLIALYTCESKKVCIWTKVVCVVMALSISISTVFIKQHYFADVISGIIFAYILYFCFKNLKFKDIPEEKSHTAISAN